MPTTKELSHYARSYPKPNRYSRRPRTRQRFKDLKRSETWSYGNLSRPITRNTESFWEKCSHLFSLARVYSPRGHREYYGKGIDAANDRIAANFPPAEVLMLEQMAETGKAQEFERLARAMDWAEHRPTHLAKVIDIALSLDLIPLVRELAKTGKATFPDSRRLHQAAAVLSPGVAVETKPAQPLKSGASQKWMKEHSSEYKGRWIAVEDGNLLGVAPTLKQLHKQIGQDKMTSQTIIVRVLPED